MMMAELKIRPLLMRSSCLAHRLGFLDNIYWQQHGLVVVVGAVTRVPQQQHQSQVQRTMVRRAGGRLCVEMVEIPAKV